MDIDIFSGQWYLARAKELPDLVQEWLKHPSLGLLVRKNCQEPLQGRNSKFCSRACTDEYSAKNPSSRFRAITLTCDGCGATFIRNGHRDAIHRAAKNGTLKRNFCTQACFRKNGMRHDAI